MAIDNSLEKIMHGSYQFINYFEKCIIKMNYEVLYMTQQKDYTKQVKSQKMNTKVIQGKTPLKELAEMIGQSMVKNLNSQK